MFWDAEIWHNAAFWLAILPPSLAILVELLNPINGRAVRKSVELDFLHDFTKLKADDRDILLERTQQTCAAVVEVSGLAPTLIASVTSGFAIIHEIPFPFWPAVCYILVFIAITLYLLWLLSGLTFSQIEALDAAAIPIPLTGRKVRFRRTTVVSFIIYLANVLLIVLAIGVFSGKEHAGSSLITSF